jgi:hypothetical protein
LLPDGYDLNSGPEPMLSGPAWTRVAPNLAVRALSQDGADEAYVEATRYLSLLARPQEPSDELPFPHETIPKGAEGYIESTMRALAEAGGAQFWVGVDHSGQICVTGRYEFTTENATTLATGTDCQALAEFGDLGLSLDLGPGEADGAGEGETLHARLLPDDYRPSLDEQRRWTFVTPNLAIRKS